MLIASWRWRAATITLCASGFTRSVFAQTIGLIPSRIHTMSGLGAEALSDDAVHIGIPAGATASTGSSAGNPRALLGVQRAWSSMVSGRGYRGLWGVPRCPNA